MMRLVAVVLIIAVAPAFAAGDKAAKGDIKEYNPLDPPGIVLKDLYWDEIDTKAFILVEGALLVPDTIRLIDRRRAYEIEVVDAGELERFEPVAQFRFPDLFPTEDNSGGNLVRFEQQMWRKGLRVAFRDYKTSGGATKRFTAFRITFEPFGKSYRSTLTLYKLRSTIAEHLDGVAKDLKEVAGGLENVQEVVESVGKKAAAASSDLKKAVAALDATVKKLDGTIRSLDRRIVSLESAVKGLK